MEGSIVFGGSITAISLTNPSFDFYLKTGLKLRITEQCR